MKDKTIEALRSELNEEKLKREELQGKYDELVKSSENVQTLDSKVDIGNNIFLSRELLSTLRTVSPTVNIYARNLFKHLFELHEILGCSLMGKACNVNKNVERQPSVDAKRRDALIGHALSVFGRKPGSELYALGMKDLKKSLSALINEMTSEAKRVEANLLNGERVNLIDEVVFHVTLK